MSDTHRPARAAHGHEASPGHDEAHGAGAAASRADLVRITLVTTMAGAVLLAGGAPSLPWQVLACAVVAAGGLPVWREALASLLERRMTMEASMTLAIGAALAIGEWLSALVILDFVLVAELLEHLMVARGRRALASLAGQLPDEASRVVGGVEQRVAVSVLQPGDTVRVRPGERVPVDGRVHAGHSFVDERSVTGEPLASEKGPGARTYAGTINQAGALDITVEQVGAQTAWGRIVQAVEAAEQSRAPVERLADRVAGWLVYAALAGAALAYALTGDLRATISVVLVAGACGVAAGTPLALLGAIGRCARAGAVVKGGPPMEALGQADTVVFDKTGTLTLGQPVVVAVQPAAGVEAARLLRAAATAERDSEHPLARAVLEHAAQAGVQPDAPEAFGYEPGRGVRCRWEGRELRVGNHAHAGAGAQADDVPGRTVLYVALDGQSLGTLHIEDEVRPDTRAAVQRLQALGLRLVLLSGDTDANAKALAARLGIPEASGGLLPHDKVAAVGRLLASGRRVAMVGDGINDAPALAASSVGIAMGGGTDLAAETAGVVLLGSRLEPVVEALVAGRRCRRIVFQNLAGTLVVDAAGMLLAGIGWLPPIAAGLVHVGSELAFILNATRMLPPRRGAQDVG